MKRKRVWRYYCEYCGKGGCSAGHIAKHERGCTLNPNRECGICRVLFEGEQESMDKLIMAFYDDIRAAAASGSTYAAIKIPRLREASMECPACILAAIRQSRLAVHVEFDFAKERDSHWDDYRVDERKHWETYA